MNPIGRITVVLMLFAIFMEVYNGDIVLLIIVGISAIIAIFFGGDDD